MKDNKIYFFGNKEIAEFTHQANRLLCEAIGDYSQYNWNNAPDWQKESARIGVRDIIEGKITSPEQSHKGWLDHKLSEGWVYGKEKNVETKTHPCIVSFDELPLEQKAKDKLFFAVVSALKE